MRVKARREGEGQECEVTTVKTCRWRRENGHSKKSYMSPAPTNPAIVKLHHGDGKQGDKLGEVTSGGSTTIVSRKHLL